MQHIRGITRSEASMVSKCVAHGGYNAKVPMNAKGERCRDYRWEISEFELESISQTVQVQCRFSAGLVQVTVQVLCPKLLIFINSVQVWGIWARPLRARS